MRNGIWYALTIVLVIVLIVMTRNDERLDLNSFDKPYALMTHTYSAEKSSSVTHTLYDSEGIILSQKVSKGVAADSSICAQHVEGRTSVCKCSIVRWPTNEISLESANCEIPEIITSDMVRDEVFEQKLTREGDCYVATEYPETGPDSRTIQICNNGSYKKRDVYGEGRILLVEETSVRFLNSINDLDIIEGCPDWEAYETDENVLFDARDCTHDAMAELQRRLDEADAKMRELFGEDFGMLTLVEQDENFIYYEVTAGKDQQVGEFEAVMSYQPYVLVTAPCYSYGCPPFVLTDEDEALNRIRESCPAADQVFLSSSGELRLNRDVWYSFSRGEDCTLIELDPLSGEVVEG